MGLGREVVPNANTIPSKAIGGTKDHGVTVLISTLGAVPRLVALPVAAGGGEFSEFGDSAGGDSDMEKSQPDWRMRVIGN